MCQPTLYEDHHGNRRYRLSHRIDARNCIALPWRPRLDVAQTALVVKRFLSTLRDKRGAPRIFTRIHIALHPAAYSRQPILVETTHSYLNLKPFFSHVFPLFQLSGRSFKHHFAVSHHINAVRNIHCDRQLLLNQQRRNPAICDLF